MISLLLCFNTVEVVVYVNCQLSIVLVLLSAELCFGWLSGMGLEGGGENKMLGLRFTPRHKRSKRFLSVSYALAFSFSCCLIVCLRTHDVLLNN